MSKDTKADEVDEMAIFYSQLRLNLDEKDFNAIRAVFVAHDIRRVRREVERLDETRLLKLGLGYGPTRRYLECAKDVLKHTELMIDLQLSKLSSNKLKEQTMAEYKESAEKLEAERKAHFLARVEEVRQAMEQLKRNREAAKTSGAAASANTT
jgi:hypothetical protein